MIPPCCRLRPLRLLALVALFAGAWPTVSTAGRDDAAAPSEDKAVEPTLPDSWVESGVRWRSIGPANMSGRITDIAVYEADPSIWYVATASGGLLKTTNHGITFEHQFDTQRTVSLGAVDVADTDPDLVWVGTGEENPRNSVSWGDGVYKSVDGGKTWTNMGLRESFQIGEVFIHPEDHDVVYVGALGRLWGPNEQRGLYRTSDGGETWEKILHVDDRTGVIEIAPDPNDPDVMLVATYERQRDGFDTNDPAKRWGPGGGVWKTTDGGETWRRITEGLPSADLGRIGIDWSRSSPGLCYMVLESARIGQEPEDAPWMGVSGENADAGARITSVADDSPAAKAGLEQGDIVLAVDDITIHSWDDLVDAIHERSAGETVWMEISRDRESVDVEVTYGTKPKPEGADEGTEDAEPATPYGRWLGGQQAGIQDRQGPDGHEFGGLYRSNDYGETWTRVNSFNPRPMYFSKVRIDPSNDRRIWILGINLNRSDDGGETIEDDAGPGTHPDHHAMWIDPEDDDHVILGNDGGVYVTWDGGENWDHLNRMAIGQFYHVTAGPRLDYHVYGGLQDNGSWGGPSRVRHADGPINEDWISIGGGDGFVCAVDPEDPDLIYYESQNGGIARINLRTGDRGYLRPRGGRDIDYRFNWRTPFLLSPHNAKVYLTAGNYVLKSWDRGDEVRRISPEIARTDRGSATALDQSPFDPDVIAVGTDDGAFWLTRNGGTDWIALLDFPAEESEDGADEEHMIAADADTQAKAETTPTPTPTATEETPDAVRREFAADEGTLQADPAETSAGRSITLASAAGQPRPTQDDDDESPDDEADEADEAEPAPEPGERRGRGRGGFAARLLRMDSDGNGSIERSEVPERMAEMFDRIDGNDDGTIDRAEIDALAGRRTGEGDRRRPGERGTAAGATTGTSATDPAESPAADPAASPDAADAADDDGVGGEWKGKAIAEEMGDEAPSFTITMSLEEDGTLTGRLFSRMGDRDLEQGRFDPETGAFSFVTNNQGTTARFKGTIADGTMRGSIDINDGMFEMDFEAERTRTARELAEAAEGEGEPDADDLGITDRRLHVDPHWTTLSDRLPGPRWVSSVTTSRHEPDRLYVTFDGHRSDDDRPYAFVSDDLGRTWTSLTATLPEDEGGVRVLAEDRVNPDLLYLGTEFGLWASIDRGATWTRLHANLPTVAVHAVAQPAKRDEIVAGTHGRSAWILDVAHLRQMDGEKVAEDVALYRPADVHVRRREPTRGASPRWSDRYEGENPEDDAVLYYHVRDDVGGGITLEILDLSGEVVRDLSGEASGSSGLHRIVWDLRGEPREDRRGRRRRGRPVEPGTYVVRLAAGEQAQTRRFEVHADPDYPDYRPWVEEVEQLVHAAFGVTESEED